MVLRASLSADWSRPADSDDLESRRALRPRGRKMEDAEGLGTSWLDGMLMYQVVAFGPFVRRLACRHECPWFSICHVV